MKARNKLKKLSRIELVELIYEIRKENVALDKRCRKLERRMAELLEQEYEPGGDLTTRLDGMEDMLREIRRQLTGRRSGLKEKDEPGAVRGTVTWRE